MHRAIKPLRIGRQRTPRRRPAPVRPTEAGVTLFRPDGNLRALDEIEAEFVAARDKNQDVARLHSGDLSIYSALAEQTRRLDRLGIPYTVTPGVPAFAAAAGSC